MPALNRIEARTNNHSLRLICHVANRTVATVRSFAESLFDSNDLFGGPTAVQA